MNAQEERSWYYYIAQGESSLDVAAWIYEFINLTIPMQKACEYEKMNGPFCNPAALDLLKKLESEDDATKHNPIWKALII